MRNECLLAGILACTLTAALEGAELVSGPMVGHTTDRSVRIWARGDAEAEMVVAVSEAADLANPMKSAPVRMRAARDFTGVCEVAGLQSATRYYYNVFLDGQARLSGELPSFRTFPSEGRPAQFRVMFGGGIRFQVDPEQVIWDDMLKLRPLAMIQMGDNVYADNYIEDRHLKMAVALGDNVKYLKKNDHDGQVRYVKDSADQRSTRVYYRIQQSLPPYRRFIAATPTYAVWDDHDSFGEGGGRGVPPISDRLKLGIQVFSENFAHPYYGGGDAAPGTWCHFSVADCDFFLLDARTYRGAGFDNRGRKPFLGEAEEQWLRERLATSKATFKFLVCGSPWNNQSKKSGVRTTEDNYYDNHGDTLASFKWARDELFRYIIEKKIAGVILLSGDRHRGDIAQVWPKGMPEHVFHDLNNCNIASRTTTPAFQPGEEGLLHSYSGRCFGTLDIDTTARPATITYTLWGSRQGRPPFAQQQVFVLRATDFLPAPVGPVRTPEE
ncbi:MAG: alkaline phosphatase D family protein [Gemmataceae bacterium]